MKAFVVLAVSTMVLAGCAGADFSVGQQAWDRGDYPTAYREWRPLATKGNVDAQSKLGLMYSTGRGVGRDPAEAAKWF